MILLKNFQIFVWFFLLGGGLFAQQNDYYGEYTTEELKELDKNSYLFIARTNLLGFLIGPIPIGAEYRIGAEFRTVKSQSVNAAVSFLGKSFLGLLGDAVLGSTAYSDVKMLGWRVQAGYRFYIGKKDRPRDFFMNPKQRFGLFVEPHIDYSSIRFNDKASFSQGRYYSITHFNATANIGIQMKWGKRIIADFFAGMGYKNNFWIDHTVTPAVPIDDNGQTDYYNSNFIFTIGTTLGYIF